jgi:hypothetical protein
MSQDVSEEEKGKLEDVEKKKVLNDAVTLSKRTLHLIFQQEYDPISRKVHPRCHTRNRKYKCDIAIHQPSTELKREGKYH